MQASKLQKIRLNFVVLSVVSTLKTTGWRFLLRENGFVINHPLHMRVLPLVSCGPPWSPVVFCGVLCCSVRCRCLPSCPLMCCSLSLCCRVVLCLVSLFFADRSLVDVSLLFLWSGIVGSWLVSCFWSICWLVLVRKKCAHESPRGNQVDGLPRASSLPYESPGGALVGG